MILFLVEKNEPKPEPAQLGCLDLDFDFEKNEAQMCQPAGYESIYYTPHKGPSRVGTFSNDGQLIATGSVDQSIKILDVERMLTRSNINEQNRERDFDNERGDPSSHPVIRTLYDHTDEVTALAFHPKEQLLLSGSRDKTIKLFDFSKPNVKRSKEHVQECSEVNALTFHPTGDYFLCGTNHHIIRLYHLQTFQSFVGSFPTDYHRGPITCINYSTDGKLYATASLDGDIRIWDSVSNRCVQHFVQAHDNREITSVKFSRNGKVKFIFSYNLCSHFNVILLFF